MPPKKLYGFKTTGKGKLQKLFPQLPSTRERSRSRSRTNVATGLTRSRS